MNILQMNNLDAKPVDQLLAVPHDLFNRPFGRLKRDLKVLDLFAGAGGFSLGFEAAGFNIKAAIEIDEWASATLSLNHPSTKVLKRDIRSLSDAELSEIGADCNIVIGGPPCQGFSVANRSAGDPDDPRNSLFREFVRAVRIVAPDVVLLENVPGLLKRKVKTGQPVIEIIINELTSLGYYVKFKVLEAQAYGVPQLRPRLFVIGFRSDVSEPFPFATHGPFASTNDLFSSQVGKIPFVGLWDAISDLPDIEARQGAEEMMYPGSAQNSLQLLLRAGSDRLHNNVAMRHSARMVERFSHIKWGESGADAPLEHQARQRGSKDKISEKQYSQNNRRMHPDRPCHTIPASFYANFIHPFKHRNFTPREGARIQTFPDWYKFEGKPTVVSNKLLSREDRTSELHLCQYNQIGNAVPPLLAYSLAKHIIDLMGVN